MQPFLAIIRFLGVVSLILHFGERSRIIREGNQLIANYTGMHGVTDFDWNTYGWSSYEYSASDYILWVEVPYVFTDQYIAVRGENVCGEGDWFHVQFFPDPDPYCQPVFIEPFSYSFSPNPANDELTISKSDSGNKADNSGDSEIVIHNSLMEKVYHFVSSDDVVKIQVGNFPEGIYYLQIANKGRIFRERILIRH